VKNGERAILFSPRRGFVIQNDAIVRIVAVSFGTRILFMLQQPAAEQGQQGVGHRSIGIEIQREICSVVLRYARESVTSWQPSKTIHNVIILVSKFVTFYSDLLTHAHTHTHTQTIIYTHLSRLVKDVFSTKTTAAAAAAEYIIIIIPFLLRRKTQRKYK